MTTQSKTVSTTRGAESDRTHMLVWAIGLLALTALLVLLAVSGSGFEGLALPTQAGALL